MNISEADIVVINKRSLSPGLPGIPNPLFVDESMSMLFEDAKQSVQDLLNQYALSGLGGTPTAVGRGGCAVTVPSSFSSATENSTMPAASTTRMFPTAAVVVTVSPANTIS